MTQIHHAQTTPDRAAMTGLRAALAANRAPMTRETFDALISRAPAADGVEYSEASVGGVPGVWCVPSRCKEGTALLYLHGGVFLLGSARAFRLFAGQIAARSGVPAFVADYRLAPEHPFPAAFDDARAAHRALVAQLGAERVAVVGDSAGGGLALSLLQQDEGAACGVLLSPWTDLALTGESIDAKASEDPILSRAALGNGVRQYMGERDPRDPRASPLFGRAPRAPFQVHVGTAEILLDDALRLASWDGAEVHVWEGMPHVFPRSIDVFEGARAAQDEVASFLRAKLVRDGG